MDPSELPLPTNKPQLLQGIGLEHDELERTLALLPHEEVTQPLLEGGWSVKDLLAHITTWEQFTIQRLAARHNAGRLSKLTARFGEGDEGLNNLNNEFYLENKDKPLADVRRDFVTSYAEFTQTVAGLSEEDLFQEGRSLIWDGAPLWQIIAGNSSTHYREHAAQVQALIDRDNRPSDTPLEENRHGQAPEDKEQLLTIVQEAHNKLMRTIDPLSPEQMVAPVLDGERSVKDVLAHITAWERLIMIVLNTINGGKEGQQDDLGGDFEGTDAFNEKDFKENKDRPLEEVRTEFDRTFHEVLNGIEAAPEEKLLGPDSPTWWGGEPTWQVIAENTYHHYMEHVEQIGREFGTSSC